MGLFRSSRSKHEALLDEEYLYGLVVDEMSNGPLRPGLMAKSLVESGGDEEKAKARYIKLRVDLLKTEGAAIDELAGQIKAKEAAARKVVQIAAPTPPTPPPGSSHLISTTIGLAVVGYFVVQIFSSSNTSTKPTTQANQSAPIQAADQSGVGSAATSYTRPTTVVPRQSAKAPEKTRIAPASVAESTPQRASLQQCEYKAVMSNDDYRACGLNPPQTRPVELKPTPAAVEPEVYDKGNHPGLPPNCRWLSQSEFSCK